MFYLGPDYEMGRSTVAAFKSSAEKVGASSTGEVFAPLNAKDYTQYFGQLRAARPQVLYTSVAGNDTVRLFTQLQEFGLRDNLTILGASGTVTSQNIGAIGKAAERHTVGAEIRANNEKLAALVFKTVSDANVGRLSYVRVYSGTLSADSHVWSVQKSKDERVGQVFHIRGKNQEPTQRLVTGDIGVSRVCRQVVPFKRIGCQVA